MVSQRDLLSLTLQSPRERATEFNSPSPFLICFKADLYPKEYFPDLTTRAKREAMDSVVFANFFLLGAIGKSLRKKVFCFLFF